MRVLVEIQFDPPDQDARDTMEVLGRRVTNDERSVRVFASDEGPDWLAVECAMPTEAPYKALETVERAVHLCTWKRLDTMFSFPRSEAERLRAQRKAERRKAKRRESKAPPA